MIEHWLIGLLEPYLYGLCLYLAGLVLSLIAILLVSDGVYKRFL